MHGFRDVGDFSCNASRRATLATRARVPLDVLLDTIRPFPTFSEIYLGVLKTLHAPIAAARKKP
jgi:dihydrolipoamide dehydrogenase